MEIINFLKSRTSVITFDVLDLKTFELGFYIKVKVILANNSELYIREYSDRETRHYSYHWQDTRGNIIMRWDNSPHHKEIETFPHHRHSSNEITSSFEIDINDVFKIIEKNL